MNRLGFVIALLIALPLWAADKSYSSLKEIQTAARKGEASAQYLLGMYYVKGAGGLPKDFKQAAVWLAKAGDEGGLLHGAHA